MKDKSIVKLILVLGSLLAMIQYFSGRSVWMDEAKLAFNIMDRSYLELLQPLDSVQVAPILFLWIQKFFYNLFGAHDWVFRLLPLLAFIVSCAVLYKLLYALKLKNQVILVATALFAFCQPLIYFASEIKQYGVDVMLGLVIMYAVVRTYMSKRNELLTLSLVGMLAVGLSNISVIMLFVGGLYYWFTAYRKTGRWVNRSVIPIALWAMTFLGYYFAFIHNHPTPDFMAPYWKEFAYMPWNIFSADFWAFWWRSYEIIFGKIMGVNPKIPLLFHVFGVAYIFGIYSFWKEKRPRLLFLLVAPFLVHIFLSALELYPFVQRVGQYLQPLFAIVCAQGFVFGAKFLAEKTNVPQFKYALILPGLVMLAITLYTFPKDREEFKESYEFMLSRKRTTDQILTNSGADNAWYYYEKIGYIKPDVHRTISDFNRYNFEGHHDQLDGLSDRIWFLISHDFYDSQRKMLESEYMLEYLKQRGGVVLERDENVGSSVYLLELPD